MKDPIAILATTLDRGEPVPFDWIVEYAPDEATFERTWRKSLDMDAKVRVIVAVEQRTAKTMRRAVAALLAVAHRARRGRKADERQWAERARAWLEDYVAERIDVAGDDFSTASMLMASSVVRERYSRLAPATRAYWDAVYAVQDGVGDDIMGGFRAATEQGAKDFTFAMQQLNAHAPTLAQILAVGTR